MKKILFILLTFGMLCGCQGKKDENVIRIETILPLTGQGATVGENVKVAIDLCAQKWNIDGGINGKLVVVKHNDSQGLPKYGQALANQMVLSENPNIVISGISGVALSAQPILEKKQILHECIVSTDKIFSNGSNYTLRNYLSTSNVCSYFIALLETKFNKESFGLLYENSDYGISFRDYFKTNESIEKTKHLLWEESLDVDNLNYKNQFYKLDIDSVEIVYVAARYQTLGRIIKQLRECGYAGLIVCDTHLNSSSALNIIGDNKADLYYIDVIKSEKTKEIQDKIREIYNIEPDNIALIAYNGLDIILHCMQNLKQYKGTELMNVLKNYQYNGIFGHIEIHNNDIMLPLTIEEI